MRRVVKNVTAMLLAFWLGGLAFYTLVVIPSGEDAIGGAEQGFVTQQVTGYLNWIGAAVCVWLLPLVVRLDKSRANSAGNSRSADSVQENQASGRGPLAWFSRHQLTLLWAVLAVCQVALFAMHPRLDALLDFGAHEIRSPDAFAIWHWSYVAITMLQWSAGVVFAWSLFNELLVNENSNNLLTNS